MNEAVSVDRLESARLFGRLTATQKGRERLQRAGYRPGMAVVPAEWDEPLSDVMARVVNTPKAPALVAVRKPADGSMSFVRVEPGDPADDVDQEANVAASIGMLVDALLKASRPWNVRLTNWQSAHAQVIEPCGQPVLA